MSENSKNQKQTKREKLEDIFAERFAHILVEQVLDEERRKNSELGGGVSK